MSRGRVGVIVPTRTCRRLAENLNPVASTSIASSPASWLIVVVPADVSAPV
jgi:hypothetical protein